MTDTRGATARIADVIEDLEELVLELGEGEVVDAIAKIELVTQKLRQAHEVLLDKWYVESLGRLWHMLRYEELPKTVPDFRRAVLDVAEPVLRHFDPERLL